MEVWALEEFSVAHIFQEMLSHDSDHVRAHQDLKLLFGQLKANLTSWNFFFFLHKVVNLANPRVFEEILIE